MVSVNLSVSSSGTVCESLTHESSVRSSADSLPVLQLAADCGNSFGSLKITSLTN